MPRVTRAELLYSRCKLPLNEVQVLGLSNMGIEKLGGFEACRTLRTVLLCSNKLPSLEGLEGCRELFRIDASNNEVASLAALRSFTTLGMLDLRSNCLDYAALLTLREMDVVELSLAGNRKLEAGWSKEKYRQNIIFLVPGAWVLDGDFISRKEREAATRRFGLGLEEDRVILDLLDAERDGFGSQQPNWGGTDSRGPLAESWNEVIAHEPAPTSRSTAVAQGVTDRYRLSHLLAYYEGEASRHNGLSQAQSVVRRFPDTHLAELQRLSSKQRLDVIVCLCSSLQCLVPEVIISEALTILLVPYLSQQACQDLAKLPHFIWTALLAQLMAQATEERSAPLSTPPYNFLEKQVLNSIPHVPVALSATHDIAGDEDLSLRARHAVILLSRSPTFPPLLRRQVTAGTQNLYRALYPLLAAAKMTEGHLDAVSVANEGAEGGGGGEDDDKMWMHHETATLGNAGGQVAALPWIKGPVPREYKRPWDEAPPGAQPEEGEGEGEGEDVGEGDEAPFLLNAPLTETGDWQLDEDVRRYLAHRDQTTPLGSMEDTVHEHSSIRARMPQVGDVVEILRRVPNKTVPGVREWTRIVRVDAEIGQVTVVRQKNERESLVLREALVWSTRGYWQHPSAVAGNLRRHTVASGQLHRRTERYDKMGVPMAEGVPNYPISKEDVEYVDPAKRMLKGYALNESWMQQFVLAPPALVEAQNRAARRHGASGWDEVEEIAYQPFDPETGAGALVEPAYSLGPSSSNVTNVVRQRMLQDMELSASRSRLRHSSSEGALPPSSRDTWNAAEEWHKLAREMGSFLGVTNNFGDWSYVRPPPPKEKPAEKEKDATFFLTSVDVEEDGEGEVDAPRSIVVNDDDDIDIESLIDRDEDAMSQTSARSSRSSRSRTSERASEGGRQTPYIPSLRTSQAMTASSTLQDIQEIRRLPKPKKKRGQRSWSVVAPRTRFLVAPPMQKRGLGIVSGRRESAGPIMTSAATLSVRSTSSARSTQSNGPWEAPKALATLHVPPVLVRDDSSSALAPGSASEVDDPTAPGQPEEEEGQEARPQEPPEEEEEEEEETPKRPKPKRRAKTPTLDELRPGSGGSPTTAAQLARLSKMNIVPQKDMPLGAVQDLRHQPSSGGLSPVQTRGAGRPRSQQASRGRRQYVNSQSTSMLNRPGEGAGVGERPRTEGSRRGMGGSLSSEEGPREMMSAAGFRGLEEAPPPGPGSSKGLDQLASWEGSTS